MNSYPTFSPRRILHYDGKQFVVRAPTYAERSHVRISLNASENAECVIQQLKETGDALIENTDDEAQRARIMSAVRRRAKALGWKITSRTQSQGNLRITRVS